MYESPLEEHRTLGKQIGVELLVKRDDLLPFPLAGNKVRKISAEIGSAPLNTDIFITTGAIASNHCRTLAFMAASQGLKAHLVLHGNASDPHAALSRRLCRALGATLDVGEASSIASRIEEAVRRAGQDGLRSHVIPGGCHTVAAVSAYSDAAAAVLQQRPDIEVVILASGTGATQAGIIDGTGRANGGPRVIGISVARKAAAGISAISEALSWVRPERRAEIEFRDNYLDGGYGVCGSATTEAVKVGWRHGLPLDATYTGKAFRGMRDLVRSGVIPESSLVLFWHTGGLWSQIEHWNDRIRALPMSF